jgi:acyl-CoA synthetase (AMP-forming)/AMP-acid ligase II
VIGASARAPAPTGATTRPDLLGWLAEPHAERGVRFARGGDGWELWTWAELAAAVRDAAARIAASTAERGGVVAIVAPNSPEFIAAFYGALLAGFTPCPLAPPKVIDDTGSYRERLRALLDVARPVALLRTEEAREVLDSIYDGCPDLVFAAARSAPEFAPAPAAELGLLQFTSGSSGRPRAVRVGRDNLEANVAAILEWTAIDPEADEALTWLPTYHDMGLIGTTLVPALTSVSIRVLRVEDFVMRPQLWLECLGGPEETCTMTATPPFGLGYAMKRVADAKLAGFDFSRWRLAIVGAERIDAGLLARFLDRFRDRGLRPDVLYPAYGLAEGTLMVTGKRAGVPRAVRLDWSSVCFGEPVTVEETTDLADRESIGDGAAWLTSCGTCPEGIGLEVVDEEGEPMPEGSLGELTVTGACVARGYLGDEETTRERFTGPARVRTADAGFVHDGELYVIGRMANALKVHGRWLFAEDVETGLCASGGLELSRCVVFSGSRPHGDEIVVLAERSPGDWVDPVVEQLDALVPDPVGVRVLSAKRGTIARTSSGKPRRAYLWGRHLAGELRAETVYERRPVREGTA